MKESGHHHSRNEKTGGFRTFAIFYLTIQTVGAASWWIVLLGWPASRAYFKAAGAPDSSLLSFIIADGLLFIGLSGVCAFGIWKHRDWFWPLLCVHAGAAGYAGLYCWTLVAISDGDGILGAAMMTPAMIVPGFIVWRLRPGAKTAC